MADPKPATAQSVSAPPAERDRVTALSIRTDGTFDQHNPELIGDKDTVLTFTKEQLSQRAVAKVDAEHRDLDDPPTDVELKKLHDAAVKEAEKNAEAIVNALHEGD